MPAREPVFDASFAPRPLPLLESLPRAVDPFSFVADPSWRMPLLLSVRGWLVAVADPVAEARDLATLDTFAATVGWRGPRPAAPPFSGGAAGFIGDEVGAAPLLLPTADPRPAVSPLPPLLFGLYDTAACWDRRGRGWLVAADLPGHSVEPAGTRLRRWRDAAARSPNPGTGAAVSPRPARTGLTRDEHASRVHQILEWIAAGDLYQLNLTLQVAVDWPEGATSLARRLWQASPGAAHAAWLRLGGTDVISVSPETFLRADGDRIRVRPIKGTRPRRDEPRADEAEAAALRSSAKDLAEHVMIVDLERNDLGRICQTGSVRVPEFAALEAHPAVWHLTSTVEGRLRRDVGLTELLAATFPCGSVTGAPKRMAVARTRLVEPVRRGVYCGAIGLVSQGLVDLSVAIRTAVLHDGVASYGAGGGIVADSDPAAEWQEALDKARPFLEAANATVAPG